MKSRLIILGLTSAIAGIGATVRPNATTTQPTPAPVVPAAPAPVVSSAKNSTEEMVSMAVEALSSSAPNLSNAEALKTAFHAYYAFKAAHPDDVKKPYLYFVDYGLSNHTPRGYVFDMDELKLVDGPFIVAHGRGSSAGKDGIPTRFGNSGGAGTTSLGVFTTAETYEMTGHAAGTLYSTIALRLDGHSGKFNDAARARGVVMHGAPYVTPTGSGRSLGCPAVQQARANKLIPMLAHGSVVVLYSPNDKTWVSQDPWING